MALDAWAVDAACDAAAAACEAEEASIREQIAALEASLKGARERHGLPKHLDARRAAYKALAEARQSAEATVKNQFQDVAHVYSSAEWAAKVAADNGDGRAE